MERGWWGRGGGRVRGLGGVGGNRGRVVNRRGRCRRRRWWKKGGRRGDPRRGVGTSLGTVHLADFLLKALELGAVDVEDPFEVAAHLALHLVYLLERVEILADDAPRLVGVGVVADNLGGNHKSRDEEAVARGATGGGEALFEAGQEEQCSEYDGLGEASAVDSVGDKVGEGRAGRLWRRGTADGCRCGLARRWELWAGEECGDEAAGEF